MRSILEAMHDYPDEALGLLGQEVWIRKTNKMLEL